MLKYSMDNVKEVISKNIQKLRKQNKMTQLEFAEKLNYSDKAVSRWENSEVLPDVETLNKIADVFNIDIKELFNENLDLGTIQVINKQEKNSKVIIALLSVCAVWILATLIYVYTNIINGYIFWLIFVYAVPVTALVIVVLSYVWGTKLLNTITLSILVWSMLASIYLSFLQYNMWIIFVLGAPIQVAIFLWSKLKIKS